MLRTRLVGIVNITPDSFSDGGMAFSPEDAQKAIGQLIADGADVIDIGAESTRPGATPMGADEEWERLEPVLKWLSKHPVSLPVSIDTRHANTAKRALDYGVHWINDVSGFADEAMTDAVKDADCMLVMMHSLSVPADKAIVLPESADVMAVLIDFARTRVAALEKAGIERTRLIFDPGIGFGKTAAQSMLILNNIKALHELEVPILVGHSRKSFLAAPGASIRERDEATLALSKTLAVSGVHYLRVHNVVMHRQMMSGLKGAKHA